MNKLRWIMLLLVIVVLSTTVLANELVAIPSPQELQINKEVTKIKGYNIGGNNYYMLRDLAVGLGRHGVEFSLWGDDKTVVANMDKIYVPKDTSEVDTSRSEVPLAKSIRLQIIQNGTKTDHTVNVYNILGYNFFKLRDIGKIMGFEVEYDSQLNRAVVHTPSDKEDKVVLGNERLMEEYLHLVEGKNVGLITNQTGIDSRGVRTVDKLHNSKDTNLVAIYSPEHGLDGKTKAGQWVESYIDTKLGLPVYSIYGKTREPSQAMLKDVDVLIFDIQDIGSRTYTYVSSMNYGMKAAKKAGIPFIVLDRPNPIGDKVEGYMLEPKYKTFVGVDEMPMSHGMTIGELAQYYNRSIGVDLTVVPMKGYTRDMVWQDTGIPFNQTSPNIPDIKSAFNYMATGSGSGTGVHQGLQFSWVGHKDVDGKVLETMLNDFGLEGVRFKRQKRSSSDGVELVITDYKSYNPARVGYVVLATINQITDITVPVETTEIPMFEKIQGTDKMGKALLAKKTPQEILDEYQDDINRWLEIRKEYLLYK